MKLRIVEATTIKGGKVRELLKTIISLSIPNSWKFPPVRIIWDDSDGNLTYDGEILKSKTNQLLNLYAGPKKREEKELVEFLLRFNYLLDYPEDFSDVELELERIYTQAKELLKQFPNT